MSNVLHRDLRVTPPRAISHYNAWSISSETQEVLDLSAGAGVMTLGYGCQPIISAMQCTIQRLPYVHSSMWTSTQVEQFARELIKRAGPQFSRVGFLNSGAEAVEAATKLALQYGMESGCDWHPGNAPAIISRRYCYHGNTMATLALSNHPRAQRYDGPNAMWPNQRWFAEEDLQSVLPGSLRYALCQKRAEPAIVVLEPIGGMASGIQVPSADWLADFVAVCREYDAILIFDEVLCGNWRTGWPFAWQYFQAQSGRDCTPDIVCMGKGLSGGYFPLSAVMVNQRMIDGMKSGTWWHSTTNQNHSIGCSAGIVAQRQYGVWRHRPAEISRVMHDWAPEFALLGMELRGIGALWGLRLPRALLPHVKQMAWEKSIALYSDQGIAGDEDLAVILIAPALMIPNAVLNDALRTLHNICARLCPEAAL